MIINVFQISFKYLKYVECALMQEEGGLTRMRRSLGEVVHRDQRDMAGKVDLN